MRGLRTAHAAVVAAGLLVGSAVGVAAQSATPVEFSGELGCGAMIRQGVVTAGVAVRSNHGFVFSRPVVEMSDPRLDGTHWLSLNEDQYPGTTFADQGVYTRTWHIENDEGSWVGSNYAVFFADGGEDPGELWLLTGAGDYEGLFAIVETQPSEACAMTLRGLILKGEPPPIPEPYAAE